MPDGVQVQGPDGKMYAFPDGTTKDAAVSYFKKKGITAADPNHPNLQGEAAAASKRFQTGATATMSAQPPWYSPAGLKQLMYKVTDKATGAMPAVGAGVGAAAGGTGGTVLGVGVGGVPGAIGGAALGGAAGEASKQLVRRAVYPSREKLLAGMTPENRKLFLEQEQREGKEGYTREGVPETSGGAAKEVAIAGLEQGAMEATGQVAGRALKAASKSVHPDEAMARLLGLSKKAMKGGRQDIETVRDIGNIVNQEVKVAGNLEKFGANISQAKEAYNQQIENVVKNSKQARLSPLHSIINDQAQRAGQELLVKGQPVQPILDLAKNLSEAHAEHATVSELLEFKRLMRNKPYWESKGLGGTKMFRDRLADAADQAIKRALPPVDSRAFSVANRKVSLLIRAEQSVKEKVLNQALGVQQTPFGLTPESVGHKIIDHTVSSFPAQVAGVAARKALQKGGATAGKIVQNAPQAVRAGQAGYSLLKDQPDYVNTAIQNAQSEAERAKHQQ